MSDQMPNDLREEYRAAFEYCDKNRHGKLDAKEFKLLLKLIGEDASDNEISGQLSGGSITFDQFIQVRQQKWTAQHSGEVLTHAFQVLDRYGEGSIDAEELKYLLTNVGEVLTGPEADDLIKESGTSSGAIPYNTLIENLLKKKA